MSETTERFLRDIADRVGLHAVDEVRLFPPLRQSGVETGVAVVAAIPLPPDPLHSPQPDEPPEALTESAGDEFLPIEEADESRTMLAARGIDTILLLSPTTTDDRLRRAAELGSGFLYAISRLGVTGARDALAAGAQDIVARIRKVTDLPVALGFGISRPDHVREVGQWADAAVVGSALVDVIAREGASPDLNTRVEEYVRWLKS